MVSFELLLLLLVVYMAVLFLVAQWGLSKRPLASRVRRSATTYALSLAVFCTAWTFFGNIGVSSRQGILSVAIYLGTTLTFVFMVPLLKKMVLLKNEFHSTNIADFISVRYHRSQLLAALISGLCLVGIIPYLTIQLKSVLTTTRALLPQATEYPLVFEYFDVAIVLMLACFTIFFGVRHLDPTEKHPGMMVALAFESLLKLLALLIGAFCICYLIYPGVGELFRQAAVQESLARQVASPSAQSWLSFMVIGALGILTLPRQFHVGVVECSEPEVLDRARWLFPLYLLIINLFTVPIAMAGLLRPELLADADLMLMTMPLAEGYFWVAVIIYLGGFSAATSMIMISAMTLSTMITNHLLIPVILYFRRLAVLKSYLLQVRWTVVLALLFLSLFYYRVIGDEDPLVQIGSISFVASVQFAPVLIGGLIWKSGNLKGALAGLLAGGALWFYCSMLPSVIRSGWLDWPLLDQTEGLFYWLDPEHLFAIQSITPLANSLLWSLLANMGCYVGVSLLTRMSDDEMEIAHHFVESRSLAVSMADLEDQVADIPLQPKYDIIRRLFSQYMPDEMVDRKLDQCLTRSLGNHGRLISVTELSALKNAAVNSLAGVIGMASAYHAFSRVELINVEEQEQLAGSFSRMFSQLQLSPSDLYEQVNFFQEKRRLLENHARQQLLTINQLEEEIGQRIQAEEALSRLNLELEQRVEQRTRELMNSNRDLSNTLDELKATQAMLLEAEKMAALGGLVAGVAHEINTPVGVVLTAITHMKESVTTILDSLQAQTLTAKQLGKQTRLLAEGIELSLKNTQRAVTLIESFKQVAVDRSEDEARRFALKAYLSDILRSLQPETKMHQCRVLLNGDDTIEIFSYPGALGQIISNLVSNSLCHGFEGRDRGEIEITVSALDEVVELTYCDDGVGLDESTREHIFEPFYTTKRGQGGSGLGAHLVYNLVVHKLRGQIALLAGLSRGTGFRIRMPVDVRRVE